MDDNKKKFGGFGDVDENSKAPRARNRTVMLTPEIAGEMRSQLKNTQSSGGTEEIGKEAIDQAKQNIAQNSARSSAPVFRPNPVQSPGQNPVPPRPSQSLLNAQRPAVPERPPVVAPVAKPPVEVEDRFDFDEELELLDQPQEVKPQPVLSRPVAPAPVTPQRVVSVEPEIDEPEEELPEVISKAQAAVKSAARPIAPKAAPPVIEEAEEGEDRMHWVKESKLCGFLVSYDKNPNGDVFFLRSGRLVISSERAGTGNLFLINDESVSPMHAILRIASASEIQVLDQLSESGTRIERADGEVVELSGDKTGLQHGDTVSFGDRNFIVCLIGS